MLNRKHSSGRMSVSEIVLVTLIGIYAAIKWGKFYGHDLGPDLANYHFYNAYVAFHKDRLLTDIFPAGVQGYLNPYIYVLPYLLYKVFVPKTAAAVIGGLHGLCFVAVYIVSRLMLADWPLLIGRLMALLCAAFGVVNPFFLAMVGSTFSDNLTPPLILLPLAFIMMVRFPDPERVPTNRRYYFLLLLSGLLVGTTVGFKLCNCAFVFGLAAAWLVNFHFTAKDIWGGVVLFGAVIAGFLLVNGEWMWLLNRDFQNPLFPFYNDIFHSPMIDHIDTNVPAWAAAHSLREVFTYPFQWAYGIPPKTEWEFTDNRFAILSILVAAALLSNLLPEIKRALSYVLRKYVRMTQDSPESVYVNQRFWFVSLWALVSYLFWIDQFGALRYLMPVTLLTGTLMCVFLSRIIPFRNLVLVIFIALAAYSLFYMKPVYFGRLEWRNTWYPVKVPEKLMQSRDTLYLKNSLSFMLPFFPDDAQFVGLGYLSLKGGLIDKGKDIIAHHHGPIRTLMLMPTADDSFFNDMQQYGLRVNPLDCVSFKAGVYPFVSCRAERIVPNQKPIVFPLPTTILLAGFQSPMVRSTSGFYNPEPDGIWTQGKNAVLNLHGVLPQSFRMTVTAKHFLGDNNHLPIKITVGSQTKVIKFGAHESIDVVFHLQKANVHQITFTIPQPVSPHHLNPLSSDERELGMMLHSITLTRI